MNAGNEIELSLPGQMGKTKLLLYITPVSRELGRRYRKAVIICPGGAYSHLSEREGYMTAVRFQAYGIQAFVLQYSVGKQFPQALIELAATVKFIREKHEEWDIDPQQIFVCGYSAGGHLAASLGVYWSDEKWKKLFSKASNIRPDGLLLCYPLISAFDFTHEESMRNLLDETDEMDAREQVSLERHISEQMPPVFLWHTVDDQLVLVENSILLIEKLQKYHIPYEAHLLPGGGHGLALADEYTAETANQINRSCSTWFQWALEWMKSRE